MTVDAWLQAALADAARRGLPELKPILEALAGATRALRAADWNDRAACPPPPAPSDTGTPESRGVKPE